MINKTLDQWLEFISKTHPSEIEMGLDRIRQVYNALKIDPKNSNIVLVAGTNGKGSTIAMLEGCLLAMGYNVGAYTSPHILEYNERVRVNGENATSSALVNAFEAVENVRHNIPLTYFEYGTLAAFDILFSEELDVVLLEIGLGGRLDAVNIVEPDISIITSVDIDHSEWLGNTRESIGKEKAGILRKNTLFIGGEDLPQTIHEYAKSLACKSLICRDDFDVGILDGCKTLKLTAAPHTTFFPGFPSIKLPENNILLSLQTLVCLCATLSKKHEFDQNTYEFMINTINSMKLPGRLERVEHKDFTDVFIDVGHNPHAANYLRSFLAENALLDKKIQVVYSSLIDKDAKAVMQLLSPVVDRCVLTFLDTDRAMPLEMLQGMAAKSGIKNVISCSSVREALTDALDFSKESKKQNQTVLTLIFGSFYMVEAAKRFFETYD